MSQPILTEGVTLLSEIQTPADAALRLAETASTLYDPDRSNCLEAIASNRSNLTPGVLHRVVALGVSVQDMVANGGADNGIDWQELTTAVTGSHSPSPDIAGKWIDACTVLAERDSGAVQTILLQLNGDGWYRGWLRFIAKLSTATMLPIEQRSAGALERSVGRQKKVASC